MTDLTVAVYTAGNTKLGEGSQIGSFSLSPLDSCPGVSEWCRDACYARRLVKQYANSDRRYAANLEAVKHQPLPALSEKIKVFRIHVSGDFFSVAYTRKWIRMIQSRPDVMFWAYTRSWRLSKMLPALEELRALPNMQLFASTDWTIEEAPPIGWRVASIQGDDRYASTKEARSIRCPEQTGKATDCASCGYCFKAQSGSVSFATH